MAVAVYLEAGSKRTFAGAIDWPGWCRNGKDESSALHALLEYGPRYSDVLRGSGVAFSGPGTLAELKVVERLRGGTTTDFGAPQAQPSSDARKLDSAELSRLEALLRACWAALDAAAKRAKGRTLRTGPRGGGRSVEIMLEHVREAEQAYVRSLGWSESSAGFEQNIGGTALVRDAAIKGMRAAAAGEIPALGPRGGKRWHPRYFVRRAAWHVLDHAWEIEDRME